MFTAIAFAHITVVAEALQKESGKEISISSSQHSYAVVLQQAVQHIPNNYYEYVLRSIAIKLGQSLSSRAIDSMPGLSVVHVIQRLCWASAIGDITLHQAEVLNIHQGYEQVSSVC